MTINFRILFMALAVVFLCAFSDVSWWVAFIGILISSIEAEVEWS